MDTRNLRNAEDAHRCLLAIQRFRRLQILLPYTSMVRMAPQLVTIPGSWRSGGRDSSLRAWMAGRNSVMEREPLAGEPSRYAESGWFIQEMFAGRKRRMLVFITACCLVWAREYCDCHQTRLERYGIASRASFVRIDPRAVLFRIHIAASHERGFHNYILEFACCVLSGPVGPWSRMSWVSR
jgi:hypothetical protein